VAHEGREGGYLRPLVSLAANINAGMINHGVFLAFKTTNKSAALLFYSLIIVLGKYSDISRLNVCVAACT